MSERLEFENDAEMGKHFGLKFDTDKMEVIKEKEQESNDGVLTAEEQAKRVAEQVRARREKDAERDANLLPDEARAQKRLDDGEARIMLKDMEVAPIDDEADEDDGDDLPRTGMKVNPAVEKAIQERRKRDRENFTKAA